MAPFQVAPGLPRPTVVTLLALFGQLGMLHKDGLLNYP